MTTIFLARHGQDEDNLAGILNGHRDRPLTELGVQQAVTTAQHIQEEHLSIEAVYSSPLQRAQETARIIATQNDLPEPEIFDLLIERDFGVMEGVPIKDIERLCSPSILRTDLVTYFIECDGAETFDALVQRGHQVISQLSEQHPNQSILLVTHGDIGKMIYAAYYGLSWKQVLQSFHFGNCELLKLSRDTYPPQAHVFKQDQHNH